MLLLKLQLHRLAIASLTMHPRMDRQGGGTGVLVRDSLGIKQVRVGILSSFEYSERIIVSCSFRLESCGDL